MWIRLHEQKLGDMKHLPYYFRMVREKDVRVKEKGRGKARERRIPILVY